MPCSWLYFRTGQRVNLVPGKVIGKIALQGPIFAKIALLCFALLGPIGSANGEESHPEKMLGNAAASGHEILFKNCARCHAIDRVGKSPLADAPPFRDVMKRYDPSDLEEALAEGIVTGHNQMPEFTFEPDEITAIIAYLNTLRQK